MKEMRPAYTAEQIRDAEQVAEILARPAPDQREILAMLGNAFIEGLVTGSNLKSQMEKATAVN